MTAPTLPGDRASTAPITAVSGKRARARARLFDLALFVLALFLRVVAVLQYERGHPNAAHPVIDEASYDRWARAIAGGDWLGKEVFFQEPLYPYALGALYAAFGPERLIARLAQCVAWALAAVLVARLARRVFGGAAAACAGLFCALHGPGLVFPSLLLKENLFLPMFAGFALLLAATRERDRRLAWWGIGALAALGALLRGNMLVLLPAFAAWPLARAWCERRRVGSEIAPISRALPRAALVLLGAGCVLAPVAIRNHAVGGVFVLSTSGAGTNLYGGNNLENPYGRASEFSFVRGVPEHEAGDWRHEAERRLGRPLDASETSSFWRDEVVRSFREHPREHLSILWNKLRLSLGDYEVPDNHSLAWDARFVPLARLPWPSFGLVAALGLAGIVVLLLARTRAAAHAQDPRAAVELALLFALYLATIVLTVTSDRSRLPLLVPLAPFAGYACVSLARAARARDVRVLATGLSAALLAAWFVHAPVMPPEDYVADHDEREYNLAVQLLHAERRVGDAGRIADELAARHPASARVRSLQAEIEVHRATAIDVRHGGREAALARDELLRSALARVAPLADDPRISRRERYRAQALAAWIQLEHGSWREALRRAREALVFDPESDELRWYFARALIGASGLPEEHDPLAMLDEARRLIEDLSARAPEEGGVASAEALALHAAQVGFLRGRLLLAGRDEARREEGREAIRAALSTLRPLAEDEQAEREIASRARVLAGWIQLYLGSLRPAENHFRRALELGPDPDARLGLAETLVRAAEEDSDPAARGEKAREVLRLLEETAETESAGESWLQLRMRVDKLR